MSGNPYEDDYGRNNEWGRTVKCFAKTLYTKMGEELWKEMRMSYFTRLNSFWRRKSPFWMLSYPYSATPDYLRGLVIEMVQAKK